MVTTFHSSVSFHYHSGSDRQECDGACSTSFPRLLQPSLRRVEDLGVLETCHRSLDPQSFCGCVTFSDGDHPVGSSVCSSGQLDGLHQPQGIVLAGTCPSGLSPLPSFCGTGQGVPVHCSLLWSLHGSAGLHTGHGSCIRNSPFLGYPHAAVPGRLACPVVLSRFSAPQPSGGSGSLSRARHCCQPSQVTLRTFSGASVSRGGHQHPVFQGFFIAGSRRQAAVNGWRISILRRSASQYLAFAAGHALLPLPSCSWRSSSGEVTPDLSPRSWDRMDQSTRIPWSQDCLRDLKWWLHLPRLEAGVSLQQVSPDLDFWSDASDVGWGAHLGSLTASGLWDLEQSALSINARELLAVREGLLHFQSSLVGRNVSVFCDNSTAVSYLRKEGGTRSPFLNSLTQRILHWAESLSISLVPQFIPGSLHLADTLSRPHQLPHTEWSLHPEVFQSLSRLWPVQIYLFATSEYHRCSLYFSPFRDPMAAGTDVFLQRWDGLQAYTFPPWSIIPRVLAKLRASPGMELTLVAPYWPQRAWFPDLLHLSLAPPVSLPLRPDLLRLPRSHNLYQGLHRLRLHAWRLRRFTRAAGFSSTVASQASLSRRPSSHKAYQLKWQVYRSGAALMVTPCLGLPCLRWLIFFASFVLRSALSFPRSRVTAPCCLRFSIFNFLHCLLIQ